MIDQIKRGAMPLFFARQLCNAFFRAPVHCGSFTVFGHIASAIETVVEVGDILRRLLRLNLLASFLRAQCQDQSNDAEYCDQNQKRQQDSSEYCDLHIVHPFLFHSISLFLSAS